MARKPPDLGMGQLPSAFAAARMAGGIGGGLSAPIRVCGTGPAPVPGAPVWAPDGRVIGVA